ncbi:unnamed protein product [Rotaria sordida]|uniref:G protein-coupled receptor kinase n=1 Tax=Rotaria sordida TaxID=392033 RepID=A0A813ZPC9_9BILA|nr:unnamed protein product [Rotaria sordida]
MHERFLLFKEFCSTLCDEPVPQLKFYEEIKRFEKLETDEERWRVGKEIYDQFIMRELLSNSHTYSERAIESVKKHLSKYNPNNSKNSLPSNLFEPYKKEISDLLRGRIFDKFIESEKYTRFCQWKNFELNIQLTMNDFSVHRIIGRGGFGEVYGCRKADTGKMYAMKCLDKKRIKMKQGETLALNERIMLSLVSIGEEGCPFIVCMTYAFHTTDKLCFILDLMNGGDLHYHLSQHGVFSEKEVKFYAAEVILGLEHMHLRSVVYRDLKPANILLDEHGHVRISDLGLACDFSKKKPHASVGTHGYMAPEVLAKGVAYDSSADWFSFGCMIYKLLKGHSPFRQHKTKDKHEIDKMTMSMTIELPETMSNEMRTLLEGLLQRDVDKRLGSMGRLAEEVKEHPYFKDIDWKQVYLLKLTPPLIPPRGEVNAADAFDIGNFDEDDTKGIKLTEADQELYKNFPIVISERWQQEITESVFDTVNQETDKIEQKRRAKFKQNNIYDDEKTSDLILQGQLKKNTGTFGFSWQIRYTKLYPNRLELHYEKGDKDPEVYTMERIEHIDSKECKGQKTITIHLKGGNEPRLMLSPQDEVSWIEWKKALYDTLVASQQHLTVSEKASKIYGADVSSTTSISINSNQQSSSGNYHNSSSSGGNTSAMKKSNDIVSFHEWRTALNDALNKSTLTLHSSKKIGRLLMPNGSGSANTTQHTAGITTSTNVAQYSQQQQQQQQEQE